MSIEMQLLSMLVFLGSVSKALAWGITADDFVSISARQLFNYLVEYSTAPGNNGALPGFRNLEAKFPSFQRCHDDSMTVEALCREVRDNRKRTELRKMLLDVNARLDSDPSPDSAIQLMGASAARLSIIDTQNSATTISGSMGQRVLEYEERERGIFRYAAWWPWPQVNDLIGGLKDDAYVLYYGRPKNKKTFVALFHAIDLFLSQRKRVLIYSKEMPEDEIWDRVLCFIASVPYDLFQRGKLPGDMAVRLHVAQNLVETIVRDTAGAAQIFCLSGKAIPAGSDSVAWLEVMAQQYKVNAIFIDGVYLMASSSKSKDDHARAAAISRELRAAILRMRIPTIATIQANRKTDKTGKTSDTDEVAFSDAFSQDATAMLRVAKELGTNRCNILIPGLRSADLEGFVINAIPCTDFSFVSVIREGAAGIAAANDQLAEIQRAHEAKARRGRKGGPPIPELPPTEQDIVSTFDEMDLGPWASSCPFCGTSFTRSYQRTETT